MRNLIQQEREQQSKLFETEEKDRLFLISKSILKELENIDEDISKYLLPHLHKEKEVILTFGFSPTLLFSFQRAFQEKK